MVNVNRKHNIANPAIFNCAAKVDFMINKNLSLKVGLLIVALAYFLFTLHGIFTLQWIGEWSRGQTFHFATFIEDISATAGTVFRFAASIIALGCITYYFSKGLPSKSRLFKILRVIVVLEGIYWLGLSTSAIVDLNQLGRMIFGGGAASSFFGTFALYVLAEVVESIVLPIALFILAYKLSAKKPLRDTVKWALIAGTVYVVTFWLVNSSLWLLTIGERRRRLGLFDCLPAEPCEFYHNSIWHVNAGCLHWIHSHKIF